jgi:predicted permease
LLSSILSDIRYSARSLASHPTFAVVVMLTLAVGIGVNVAIFSLFQQILLRPLPVADPDRLVNFSDPGPKPNSGTFGSMASGSASLFTYPMFRDLERAQGQSLRLAAHRIFGASLSTGERARLTSGIFVSGSYFSVLGLQPSLGRLLGPQDDLVDGRAESVVLSHAYWQSELGGDPEVLGRTLIVNGTPLAIVGVAPRGFHGTTVGVRASVFVPITFSGADYSFFTIPDHDTRTFYWLSLFARLGPGVTREQAATAINPFYRAILNETEAPLLTGLDEQRLEEFRTKSLVLEPGARGQSSLLVPVRGRLEMLFAISGVVLLLCCANVAGLVLVRGSARSGEMAVRASMGATRGRLASLLLAESLLLAAPAAILSLPLALLTMRAMASGVPGIPPAAFDVGLSFGAAFVAIAMAVVSAIVFGLFPLRHLMRTEPSKALQSYGVRQTSGKGVTGFRTALATVQIALSMTLLSLTGVFAQSLANIARIDLGLDVDSVVAFSIKPETSGYAPEASAQLLDRLEDELAAVPGVTAVTSAAVPVLGGVDLSTTARADGAEGPVEVRTLMNSVSPDFFRTFDIGVLAGRDFNVADTVGTAPVAIVNERFAERLGLARDVIGRRVRYFGTDAEIVGLAADAGYANVTEEIQPLMFSPLRQATTRGSAMFYVRGTRPPAALMTAIRGTVARVDPIVPIEDLRSMRQQVRENLATERFVAGASTLFAVLATVLAGLGLYGLLAYSVAQRSREIGLRFALGAPADRIRGMVLRQVAAMALIGVAVGAAAAWLLGRVARALLFGVEAGDPVALVGAGIVLAAVTLGAAYLPARRASRVDPIVVLRYD